MAALFVLCGFYTSCLNNLLQLYVRTNPFAQKKIFFKRYRKQLKIKHSRGIYDKKQ